ncbi:MAG TPA: glycosyltransferase family 2 protein [Opitutaceae bacterium]|jgi:glycosyltransferase involved in cell wall biosynthesis
MHTEVADPSRPGRGEGVSFIIPCFNEKPEVIRATVERVRASVQGRDCEVIVVDDASTSEPCDTAVLGGARIVRHKVNRGYGASLASGLRVATHDWIGIIDADGTYPAERFADMLALAGEYQMVVGARDWNDISPLRRLPKRFLTWLAGYLAHRKIPDLNSGMRIFRREIYDRSRRIYPERFSFSSTLTMVGLTAGYEVLFLPIGYSKRVGRSSIHPVKDPIRFGYQLLRLSLYFRPLRVFVPMSLFVGLLAVGRGMRDLSVNDHFGGLTLVLFFMSFQIFFFGLIAEIINKK